MPGGVTPAQIILLGLTLVSVVLLVWQGRTPERVAALGLAVLVAGTPFVDEGSRHGVALLSIGVFLLLFGLMIVYRRWWLIFAAGLQFVAVSTHIVTFQDPDMRMWANVTIRLIVWLLIMLTALFGVGEARWAPYARDRRSSRP